MSNAARLLCLLAAAAALAGCVETRFESPLGDNIETCDPRWKGVWADPESSDEPSAIYVDDECHFMVLDQPEKSGPIKRIHVPMNYVHADGKDYIVVADTSLKGLVELKPPYGVDPVPEKAFFFARYQIRGDRLEVNQVDSERVAKLVIDGKIDGSVSKTGSDLHVFVRGSRTRMLEIVRTQSIFQDKSQTKLVRRKQTVDEFEQSVIHAQRNKQQ
ncbi:MAG TPA: hypothetical protein VFE67_18830 [Rudaea sp.]|jgi:hypothetical protein|nr:hypothetical protein [Rudaea sp.]